MHIKDIESVNEINAKLEMALKKHRVLDNQLKLKPDGDGFYYYGRNVSIGIGCDSQGGGEQTKVTIPISDSVDAKRILLKMKSDAWGVVCGLRIELRTLGVNLDNLINNKE